MRAIRILIIYMVLTGTALAGSPEVSRKPFTASMEYGVQKVEVAGGEYFFNPDHIIVKVNVPVELKIMEKPGFVPHNIVFNNPEAGLVINEPFGSEPKVIRFTPTKTGKYSFYCDKKLLFFKSHREKGMKGIIEVIE